MVLCLSLQNIDFAFLRMQAPYSRCNCGVTEKYYDEGPGTANGQETTDGGGVDRGRLLPYWDFNSRATVYILQCVISDAFSCGS